MNHGSEINNCYSTASTSGELRIGGLVGSNNQNGTIIDCFSKGFVEGTNSGYEGGLVGEVGAGASTSNSFWDTQTSGQATSAGGTVKTTAEMQNYDTFTNTSTTGLSTSWDFIGTANNDVATNNIWDMDQEGHGYPILSWQSEADAYIPVKPSGSGTEGAPYQITNLEDLYWLSKTSSSWDCYFLQTVSIDAGETSTWDSDSGFTPIGNELGKFTGVYDGGGYEIDSLTISRSGVNNVGLFGYLSESGTKIENLGVTNADVYAYSYIGNLVGHMEASTTINNCYSSGSAKGAYGIGGIAGKNEGGTVRNS